MRNLTIINNTTHVPSLSKTKIYVEDHAMPDTVINGIPCRKLGVVNNGDSATFKITEKPAIVFAVTSRGFKNYYSECYEINGEYGDVVLSGKRHFNPFKASPFVFEGGGSEEVNENRKKAFKKLMMGVLIVFGIIVMLNTIFNMGSLIGSFGDGGVNVVEWKEDAPAKEFTDYGVNITLSENFVSFSDTKYKVVYDSQKMTIFVTEKTFEKNEGFDSISVEEFLKKTADNSGLKDVKIVNENGLCYFVAEIENSNSDVADVNYVFGFKTDKACVLVNFVHSGTDTEELKDDIFVWAKSIKFE